MTRLGSQNLFLNSQERFGKYKQKDHCITCPVCHGKGKVSREDLHNLVVLKCTRLS